MKLLSPGGARCVFETVKTDVSARSAFSARSLRKLILGCFWARFLSRFGSQVRSHIPFGGPGGRNSLHF